MHNISSPAPATVAGWFALFQENRLLGLLSLELLIIVSNVLAVPMYLAFYAALRRTSVSFMAIAAGLGLVGIAAVFSARPAFDMLYLSGRYAAATTDAQRSAILAAGESSLAVFNGSASQVSYVLAAVALMVVCFVMLRGRVFGKGTAYVGILANILALGFYLPGIGIFLALLSVLPFLLIWNILIARRFFQLASGMPLKR